MPPEGTVPGEATLAERNRTSAVRAFSISVSDSVGLNDDVVSVQSEGQLELLGAAEYRADDRNRAVLALVIGTRTFPGYIVDGVSYKSKPAETTLRGRRTADRERSVEAVRAELDAGLPNVVTWPEMAAAQEALETETLADFVVANVESLNKTAYSGYIDALDDVGIVLTPDGKLVALNSTEGTVSPSLIGPAMAIQDAFEVAIARYPFRPRAVHDIAVKCGYRSLEDPTLEGQVGAADRQGEEHFVREVATTPQRASALVVIEYEKLLARSATLKVDVPGSTEVSPRQSLSFPGDHWVARNVWPWWRVTSVTHNWREGAYITQIEASPAYNPRRSATAMLGAADELQLASFQFTL